MSPGGETRVPHLPRRDISRRWNGNHKRYTDGLDLKELTSNIPPYEEITPPDRTLKIQVVGDGWTTVIVGGRVNAVGFYRDP